MQDRVERILILIPEEAFSSRNKFKKKSESSQRELKPYLPGGGQDRLLLETGVEAMLSRGRSG